jgi:hypothetical protein
MSYNSIKYSLNNDIYLDTNILNKKIIDLIKNNNLEGGSSLNKTNSSSVSLIIGIIVIIIGFVLLWYKNDLIETDAIIVYRFCDNNDECKINITYVVDSTQYSKIINLNKNNVPNESTIKIYYQQTEPNSIHLINPNYYVIGITSIVLGSFIILFSLFDTDSLDMSSKSSSLNNNINLYSNLKNNDSYQVVYTT